MINQIIDKQYITGFNDRLDKICYLRYGSDDNDIVIFVLDKNTGLENQDIVLQPGIVIALPDAPDSVTTPVRSVAYLWT